MMVKKALPPVCLICLPPGAPRFQQCQSWTSLMISIKKIDNFCHFKKTGYRRTDGRTDTPSYRDGWIHLKRNLWNWVFSPTREKDWMFTILTIRLSTMRTTMFDLCCNFHHATCVYAFVCFFPTIIIQEALIGWLQSSLISLSSRIRT